MEEYLCHSMEKLRTDIMCGGAVPCRVLPLGYTWTWRMRSVRCLRCSFGWSGTLFASISVFEMGLYFLKKGMLTVPLRMSVVSDFW